MKPAAWCASLGIAAAVPLLYKSPEKLCALAGFTAAAYWYLKPLPVVVGPDELDPERRSVCTDRYSEDKIPEDIDTIVIGSGMSGITAGAILARMGETVLILEQHDRTGGGSHEYELGKNGYHFDAGLHYVVPECAQLLQLCTGGDKAPVLMDMLGEPKCADGNSTSHSCSVKGPDKHTSTACYNVASRLTSSCCALIGSITYERVYVGADEPVFEMKIHQKHFPELRRRCHTPAQPPHANPKRDCVYHDFHPHRTRPSQSLWDVISDNRCQGGVPRPKGRE